MTYITETKFLMNYEAANAIIRQWYSMSHNDTVNKLREMSSAEIEAVLPAFIEASNRTKAKATFYTFWASIAEVIDERLDKYQKLRPNYTNIITTAVKKGIITRMEAIIFSVDDKCFLDNISLTQEEQELLQRYYNLKNTSY